MLLVGVCGPSSQPQGFTQISTQQAVGGLSGGCSSEAERRREEAVLLMSLTLPSAGTERKLTYQAVGKTHCHLSTKVSKHACTSTHTGTHTHQHMHQHTQTSTYTQEHIHQHTHPSTDAPAHTSTYTSAHTHQHTCTGTHTQTQLQNSGLSIQSPYNDPWLLGLPVVSGPVASGLFTPVKTQTS